MPRISVFMPVYNGSVYLERSIGSVMRQTFADWELIALDDGSTDNSRDVLDALARKDSRIRVFSKENDSNGNTARNMEIMNQWAEGEYFFYMSQDDRIAPDLLDRAFHEAVDRQLDIVVPNMLLEDADDTLRAVRGSYPPGGDYSLVLTGREAFYESIDFSINGFALIRRSLMNDKRLDTSCYDSDEYNTRVQFLAADRVGFCNSTFYYYQGNADAITKRFSVCWFQRLDTAVMLDRLFTANIQDYCSYPKLKSWLMGIYISLCVTYMRQYDVMSSADKKSVRARFRKFESEVGFADYRLAVIRRLSRLEGCFALWYFISGTCRNMRWLYSVYKYLKFRR